MKIQKFMKLKPYVPPVMAILSLLVLVGLVTAATLDRAGGSLAGGDDPTDRNITRVTTSLLEHSQFSHQRLDSELAAKFLDRYLDSLDPSHLLFLQADTQEFNGFCPRLPDLTRRKGDLSPERIIFQRFLERLEQRGAYVTNLLPGEDFDFTGHETVQFDRAKAPRPADLDAAHKLWSQNLRAEYLQEKLAGKKPAEIVAALTLRYSRLNQTMKKLTSEDVLDIYLNALAHVYDPHSDYFGHEQMDDFSIALNLSLVGIGATLHSDNGYCIISDLVPGGPAAQSGLLKPGDRIVAVGQGDEKPLDVVDMPLPDAVKLIRGPKGTTVRLVLIPDGATEASPRKTITLVRNEVKLKDQQAKASVVDWPQTNGPALRLGVIELPEFYGGFDGRPGVTPSSATADVAKLIRKLEAEHIQGLVLDLRQNGGGSLSEAISLTGLFIHEGPVVQIRTPDGRLRVDSDEDSAELYDGPMIVLTSRFTASASEILAGALQDYGRALIVGDESTYGKGTVQTVVPLARLMDQSGLKYSIDPGALKVTIQKFYRPSGTSTQLKGVMADIVLPSLTGVADVGEAKMEGPLAWDVVPPADFIREDQTTPFVKELRARSAARVDREKDFEYLREDIARFQKDVATQTVSLNEADRRREYEAAKARAELRKQELLARRESQPRTCNVTVENSDAPDLPAPVAIKAGSPETKLPASAADKIANVERGITPNDPVLCEAEHIMADYVDMLHLSPAVAVVTH